jgi:hypothetical protein
MMAAARYTTNLSKAQGMIPETYELLQLWQPGMRVGELKARVRETGALGRATQVRVDDLVGRSFAQRYLVQDGLPAQWLRQLMEQRAPKALLRQLILIYTARANPVLHDFICEVFWKKWNTRAGEVTKQDARDFLERAVSRGDIAPRWSDNMIERVTRYLLGTLEDFEMIVENRFGQRQIRPPTILPETVVFLAYEQHFAGYEPAQIILHPNWGMFGLLPNDVIGLLEKASLGETFLVQHSGAVLRIEWSHTTMEEVLRAIAH